MVLIINMVELMKRYSRQSRYVLTDHKLQRIAQMKPRPVSADLRKPVHRHKVVDRLSAEQLAEIAQQYRAGTPTTALCRMHDLSKGAVLKVLTDAGVTMRRQPMTPRQIARAFKLYEAGDSLSIVAEKIGTPQATVRKGLLAAGVVLRPSGGSAPGRTLTRPSHREASA